MPYFYCHLRGPSGYERDEIGLEFADLDAAYLEVCRAILDMAAELARSGHDPMPYAFEITDADGLLLMDVPFREMLSKGLRSRRRLLPARRPRSAARWCGRCVCAQPSPTRSIA
ncbi:DUF6894 family protein [Methylobacterium sp. E-016]|uniref:DUF6894 family protein n=1 Tax=Methylobacterium sp. E-016 TaxID=2836556 RepID=UPI00391977A7